MKIKFGYTQYIRGIYQVYIASQYIHGIYMVYTDYKPRRGSRCGGGGGAAAAVYQVHTGTYQYVQGLPKTF